MFGKKSGDYTDRISEKVHVRLGIPKEEVEKLISQEPVRKELSYMKHQRIPERIAYIAITQGITEAMKEGKPLSGIKPEDVARGVYETLAADRQYRGVAQHMLEDGVIDNSDLKKILKRTEQSSKEAARTGHILEDLLKKAAVILLLLGGVYYIFKSFSGITGGVIGVAEGSNIMLGLVLFMFALAITHFFIKE